VAAAGSIAGGRISSRLPPIGYFTVDAATRSRRRVKANS